MKDYQKFVKDISLVGITHILTFFTVFLTMPIYTNVLGPALYGVFSLVLIFARFVGPAIRLGLDASSIRYLAPMEDKEEINKHYYVILFTVIITGLALAIGIYLVSPFIENFLVKTPEAEKSFKLAAPFIVFSEASLITLTYFRVFRRMGRFSLFKGFISVGELLFGAILLLMGYGLIVVLGAMIFVRASVFIILLFIIISELGIPRPHFKILRRFLKYGVPLIPQNLLIWLLKSSSHYIIAYFMGAAFVGIYSVSYKIANIFDLLIFPISSVLFPNLSKVFRGDSDLSKKYIKHTVEYFLMLSIPILALLSAIGDKLIVIFSSKEFLSNNLIIVFLGFGNVFLGLFMIFSYVLLLNDRTKLYISIIAMASTFNILLNIIVVPIMGLIGAAVSTLTAHFLMFTICYYYSKQYLKTSINKSIIGKIVIASFFLFFVMRFGSPSSILSIILFTIIGFLVYFSLLFLMKVLSKKEFISVTGTFFKGA